MKMRLSRGIALVNITPRKADLQVHRVRVLTLLRWS